MRLRWVGGSCFLLGVLVLTVEPLPGQPGRGGFGGGPPGGFGGGSPGGSFGGGPPGGFSRGGSDAERAERTFGFLARGSGGEIIDFGKMDPNQRVFAKGMMERMGLPAPSDNTVITKAQFTDLYTKAAAAKAAASGGTPGGPPGGMTMSFQGPPGGSSGGPPGGFGQPGGFGGPPGGSFGGPPAGGPPGGSDDDMMRRFRERDRNQDGKITPDEASDRMRGSFEQYDLNRDGFVDFEEFKVYMNQFSRGGSSSGPPSGSPGGPPGSPSWGGGPPGWGGGPPGNYPTPGGPPGGGDGRRDERKTEDPALIAIRYGKLPQGLPDWFAELDTDRDGQVGLYEWRAGSRDMKEFLTMDLNGDGLIDPQELIRYTQVKAEQDRLAAKEEGIETGTSGGRSGFGGRGSFGGSGAPGGFGNRGSFGGQPTAATGGRDTGSTSSKSDRKEERREEKGSSGNRGPWGGGPPGKK